MGGLERLARSAAAAGILAGAFGVVRPAAADTFGGCNTDEGCRPDNRSHAWCYGNGFTSTALRNAATYALGNLDAQTNFNQNRTTSCTTTTDVRSEEHTYELQSLMRSSSAVFCLQTQTTA